MILRKYIFKEIFLYFVSLTFILLLVLLSHIFVRYLTEIAIGKYPAGFLLKMVFLEIPSILSILLPLGLYLSLLFVLGRMYVDREMIVIISSGVSEKTIIWISLFFAVFVAFLVAYLSLWVSPQAVAVRNEVRIDARSSVMVDMLTPGKFHSISGGKKVVYVQNVTSDGLFAKNLFLAQKNKKTFEQSFGWDVVTSKKAYIEHDAQSDQKYVVLNDGYRYAGTPGTNDFQVIKFKKYGLTIPDLVKTVSNSIKGVSTVNLFKKGDGFTEKERAAEFQWRLSLPISVLLLSLLAIPLGRLKPHQGKYSKIFPAVVIYIIYINLIFWARDLLRTDQIAIWFGIWWVHILVLFVTGMIYSYPRLKSMFKFLRESKT